APLLEHERGGAPALPVVEHGREVAGEAEGHRDGVSEGEVSEGRALRAPLPQCRVRRAGAGVGEGEEGGGERHGGAAVAGGSFAPPARRLNSSPRMPPETAPFAPALIGGTGRSGTTVLRDVLARHPAVCDFPESRFLVDPDGL